MQYNECCQFFETYQRHANSAIQQSWTCFEEKLSYLFERIFRKCHVISMKHNWEWWNTFSLNQMKHSWAKLAILLNDSSQNFPSGFSSISNTQNIGKTLRTRKIKNLSFIILISSAIFCAQFYLVENYYRKKYN